MTVKTDESGRAQFDDVPRRRDGQGDGRRRRRAPRVAGVPGAGAGRHPPDAGRDRPGQEGRGRRRRAGGQPATSSSAAQSRIVIQPGEEAVDVFYLLDIVNNASVPVNPPTPFAFDMPDGATGAAIMEGSSPQASVNGHARHASQGPFAPGHTFVQVARVAAGRRRLDRRSRRGFPANLEQLAVIVKKVGDTTLTSPQLKEQREMPARRRDVHRRRPAARWPPGSRSS